MTKGKRFLLAVIPCHNETYSAYLMPLRRTCAINNIFKRGTYSFLLCPFTKMSLLFSGTCRTANSTSHRYIYYIYYSLRIGDDARTQSRDAINSDSQLRKYKGQVAGRYQNDLCDIHTFDAMLTGRQSVPMPWSRVSRQAAWRRRRRPIHLYQLELYM